MAGNMCELGTLIWRATDGGHGEGNLFVCPAGMEYIDRQFEAGNRLAIGSKWRKQANERKARRWQGTQVGEKKVSGLKGLPVRRNTGREEKREYL